MKREGFEEQLRKNNDFAQYRNYYFYYDFKVYLYLKFLF